MGGNHAGEVARVDPQMFQPSGIRRFDRTIDRLPAPTQIPTHGSVHAPALFCSVRPSGEEDELPAWPVRRIPYVLYEVAERAEVILHLVAFAKAQRRI